MKKIKIARIYGLVSGEDGYGTVTWYLTSDDADLAYETIFQDLCDNKIPVDTFIGSDCYKLAKANSEGLYSKD